MGLFGGDWSDKLGNMGTSLMAAQASLDGDFGTSTQIMGLQQKRAQEAREQAEKASQQQRLLAGLKAQGLTDEQAMLVLHNAGSIGDFRPKAPEAPSFVKNLEAWQQMDPARQREVARMQSVLNPAFATGPDGRRYQDAPAQVPQPAPWQQNPDEWEMVPGPGGAGPQAPRPFPSNIPSGSPLAPPRFRR